MKKDKEKRKRLKANLSLMVPIGTTIQWAIRGGRKPSEKVFPAEML